MSIKQSTIAVIAGLLFVLSAPAASHAKTKLDTINRSVVKIFSISRAPSFSTPWQYKMQKSATGTGVIISGNRILTNAHVVSDSVFIQVKKANDPQRYTARIEKIGHQCDLAILKIDNLSFFDETKALNLGKLPKLQDEVSVFGFPMGGNEISITKGIVSRIEQMEYTHSSYDLLGVQIDAAINPGNSGGPALEKGKIIGIVMQGIQSSNNIGYIIPTPIIKHFLKDVEDGSYDGFPDSGIFAQGMESESLRKYYGLKNGEAGLLVHHVSFGSSAYGFIQKDDVIVEVDGISTANDGTIKLNKDIRLAATYLVRSHYLGETLKFGVIRDKKKIDISMPLKPNVQLIPKVHDKKPSYYIFGGLILMPLTKNYLMERGRKWYYLKAPPYLRATEESQYPTEKTRELVIIGSVLAHKVNIGYHKKADLLVSKVNGIEIGDMLELVTALENSSGKFTRIETKDGTQSILDNKAVKESEAELLKRYDIKEKMSPDLKR